ncbi:MAG TPA: hypothetical protein VGA64_11500 [Candidatus Polarisedimenticolia bacterium]
MSRPLPVGARAPRIDLPGIPGPFDSRPLLGAPLVVEFIRGTW